jgi:IstB-like ATP binding protein
MANTAPLRLVEHLRQADAVDRSIRSIEHQMQVANFPVHRDLAGFDFDVSPVDRKLVMKLRRMVNGLGLRQRE